MTHIEHIFYITLGFLIYGVIKVSVNKLYKLYTSYTTK